MFTIVWKAFRAAVMFDPELLGVGWFPSIE